MRNFILFGLSLIFLLTLGCVTPSKKDVPIVVEKEVIKEMWKAPQLNKEKNVFMFKGKEYSPTQSFAINAISESVEQVIVMLGQFMSKDRKLITAAHSGYRLFAWGIFDDPGKTNHLLNYIMVDFDCDGIFEIKVKTTSRIIVPDCALIKLKGV